MATPKSIEELRQGLLDAYEWVKTDPRRANQVKEMTNAAGKIIGTLKVELEYAMLRGNKPLIEFLGGDKHDNHSLSNSVKQKLLQNHPTKSAED